MTPITDRLRERFAEILAPAINCQSPYAKVMLDTLVAEAAALVAALTPTPAPQEAETFNFLAHLRRQREWSGRTFGPGPRTAGVVDHIRKELREIEAAPADLSEWIDVAILALDGSWRAGHMPEVIIEALAAKQAKNEARQWPDWRTAAPDKAIEHVKSVADARAEGPMTTCNVTGYPSMQHHVCQLPRGHEKADPPVPYHRDGSVTWLGYHTPTAVVAAPGAEDATRVKELLSSRSDTLSRDALRVIETLERAASPAPAAGSADEKRRALTMFAGFLSAQLPELHQVETGRLIDQVEEWLAITGGVVPPTEHHGEDTTAR